MPTITPLVGSVALSTSAQGFPLQLIVRPPAGVISRSSAAPALIIGSFKQPASAACTLTGNTPVLRTIVRPGSAALTFARNPPSIFYRIYQPAAAALTLTRPAPSVVTELIVLYATWDPNFLRPGDTLSVSRLSVTDTTNVNGTATRGTVGKSKGKYYCEMVTTLFSSSHTLAYGIAPDTMKTDQAPEDWGIANRSNGLVFLNGVQISSSLENWLTNDVVGIAVDFNSSQIWFRKNAGNWNNNASANPATGVGGLSFASGIAPTSASIWFPVTKTQGTGDTTTVNFGASTFANAAPSGYLPWTADLFFDGTAIRTMAGASGSYEIPKGGSSLGPPPPTHWIDAGYATPCLVDIAYAAAGVPKNANFFAYNPLFDVVDFFGATANQLVEVFPQISISQDPTSDANWSDWMRYQAGTYLARGFRARMVLSCLSSDVIAFLTQFKFTVYVPTRVDNWGIIGGVRTSLNNLALAASPATTITFLPDTQTTAVGKPFNGGVSNPNQPSVVVTELNWQTGDIVVLTSLSLSQVTVQVTNGGVGVARNVNIRPEGY